MRAVELTEEQRQLVTIDGGAYLVTAPPGSGKTEVLVQRILHILKSSQGQSFRILALTFTNKAAESLAQRIREELSEDAWRVTTSTFHTFCLSVLRHYGDSISIDADVSVYENDDDRRQVLATALANEGYDFPVTPELLARLLARIDRRRRELDLPMDEQIDGFRLHDVYLGYEDTLRRYHAIDFDGILLHTYRLFAEFPRIARHYRRVYGHIMVDEAQDTNLAQYQILRTLCGDEYANVFLIADQNQSMYRFAGGDPRHLKSFVKDFRAESRVLTSNFRCAKKIVVAANSLLDHSPRASNNVGPMVAVTGAAGAVEALSFLDEEHEAKAVADWAEDLIVHGFDPSWVLAVERETRIQAEDICLMARSRYALQAIIEELRRRGLDFQYKASERDFFDSNEFHILYYALRVFSNPHDLPGRQNLDRLLGIESASEGQNGTTYLQTRMCRFSESGMPGASQISQLFTAASQDELTVDELVDRLLKIDPQPAEGSEGWKEESLWRADKKTFEDQWRLFCAKSLPAQRSLAGFLGHLSVARRATLEGPGIRVLTVHAAKGLEFPAVALLGMNDGIFPDFRNLDSPDKIDDERRNAYVAVTRAGRLLRLSRSRSRHTQYGPQEQLESRFIREMGLTMRDG